MENFDFIGFTYNGKHSYRDLGIYRTIDGSRYNNNLTATLTEKTSDIPGGDGQYYFGTTLKNRTFTVQFAFDSLTETQLRQLKQEFNGEGIHDLIFDEEPYKVWSAKVTGTASLKHICFQVGEKRVYKGEGSITFTCYYPYAHTPTKLWQFVKEGEAVSTDTLVYKEADGRNIDQYSAYLNLEEWEEASGLDKDITTIKGDIPTPFVLTLSRNDESYWYTYIDSNKIEKTEQIAIELEQLSIKTDKTTYSLYFDEPEPIFANDVLKWNSKNGLLTKNNIPIKNKGEGVVGLVPGEKYQGIEIKAKLITITKTIGGIEKSVGTNSIVCSPESITIKMSVSYDDKNNKIETWTTKTIDDNT